MQALVADDDQMTALMLSRSLERLGCSVTTVHDGATAWDAIAGAAPPAIAIVDWMMPGLDGVELCRRLRSAELRSYVYVTILTSRTSRQDLVAALDAGADDYLTKPFDPDELRARVRVGQRMIELLASVKQLRGLLPMCSYCKRIRDDQNYWEQVEQYISHHTDVRFSHGICPTCYEKAIADLGPEPAASSSDK